MSGVSVINNKFFFFFVYTSFAFPKRYTRTAGDKRSKKLTDAAETTRPGSRFRDTIEEITRPEGRGKKDKAEGGEVVESMVPTGLRERQTLRTETNEGITFGGGERCYRQMFINIHIYYLGTRIRTCMY